MQERQKEIEIENTERLKQIKETNRLKWHNNRKKTPLSGSTRQRDDSSVERSGGTGQPASRGYPHKRCRCDKTPEFHFVYPPWKINLQHFGKERKGPWKTKQQHSGKERNGPQQQSKHSQQSGLKVQSRDKRRQWEWEGSTKGQNCTREQQLYPKKSLKRCNSYSTLQPRAPAKIT